MNNEEFLTKHISPPCEFLAGFISIDIADHSKLKGSESDISDTKARLAEFITSQLGSETGTLLSWQGDGGILLFDIASGCDEMIMFADRIRQLVPLFNRTIGILNKLANHQELMVRIVCHAGTLINKDGNPAHLSGQALNLLAKKEREIGRPGYVVLTSAVYQRLSVEFQDRCQITQIHADFGKFNVLDHKLSLGTVVYNDRRSNELKEWILVTRTNRKFDRLLYFSYTNELLYEFLCYEMNGLEVRIVTRDWVVEHNEEKLHNEKLEADRRPWYKSKVIQLRAKEIVENVLETRKQIDVRFYSSPPLFNGAILESDKEPPMAYVGIIRWEERPVKGGSQFKLAEWPAIILNGRDKIHRDLISNLQSRFHLMWRNGLTYEQVCIEDETQRVLDPAIIGKIWKLDCKTYLLVYPHRRIPERPFQVVANEDLRAFHLIEKFLNRYNVETNLLSFETPDVLKGDWFPEDTEKKINEWQGHVIFICTKSLSSKLNNYLKKINFPYEIGGVGTLSPFVKHRMKSEVFLESPMDKKPPEPRDYSIIARFRHPKHDSCAYITAGIHAMGTWGAVDYLTNPRNIRVLSQLVKTENFAAIVETKFDPDKHEVTDSSLYIAPEEF